jgi:hypothetical protein
MGRMPATATSSSSSARPRFLSVARPYEHLTAVADDYVECIEAWACTAGDTARLGAIAADLVRLVYAAPHLSFGMSRHLPFSSTAMRHAFFAAIVGLRVAQSIRLDPIRQLAVAKAALIMNLASFDLQDDLAGPRAEPSAAQRITLARHPLLATALLLETPGADLRWIEAVAQHHEAMDGSGYPGALQGEQICLEARILRLADMWCALVAPHRSRAAKSPREALHWLLARSRQCLDPHLFDVLRRETGHFPPGTLVRLANRETALVADNPRGTAAPRQVIAFLGAHGSLYRDPVRRDTGRAAYAVRGHVDRLPQKIRQDYWGRIWELSDARH